MNSKCKTCNENGFISIGRREYADCPDCKPKRVDEPKLMFRLHGEVLEINPKIAKYIKNLEDNIQFNQGQTIKSLKATVKELSAQLEMKIAKDILPKCDVGLVQKLESKIESLEADLTRSTNLRLGELEIRKSLESQLASANEQIKELEAK